MAANSPPFVLQAGSHPAQLFRQAVSSLLGYGSNGSVGNSAGVIGSGDYAVTQNGTPNMSVNVAAGNTGGAWILGTSTSTQGLYFGYNDAVVNLAIAASNPTNPRIDIAVAQVQDAAYAGGTNSFQVAIVTGTPAGSPVAPTQPASSLLLANIAVAANATTVVTGNITDKRLQFQLNVVQAWTNLTLPGSWTPGGSNAPRVRVDPGGVVRFAGSATNNTGGTVTAGSTIATVPSAANGNANYFEPPVAPLKIPAILNATTVTFLSFNNPLVTCGSSITNGQSIAYDGVTYTQN